MSGSDVITGLKLENGTLEVRHFQDCEDIVAHNKALRGAPQKSDWGRHIATIPNNILLKWMLEEGVPVFGMPAHEWGRFLRKKLADPDWRDLRTD